jgi:hypothetical protein
MSILSEVKAPTDKTPKPPPPTATYEIGIKMDGDDVEADPFPGANVGETVRYNTTEAHGEVSIKFVGPSMFRTDDKEGTTVPGGVILTVVSESIGRKLPNNRFQYGCFITVPDEKDKSKTITKGYGHPKAGGTPRVPRPGT